MIKTYELAGITYTAHEMVGTLVNVMLKGNERTSGTFGNAHRSRQGFTAYLAGNEHPFAIETTAEGWSVAHRGVEALASDLEEATALCLSAFRTTPRVMKLKRSA